MFEHRPTPRPTRKLSQREIEEMRAELGITVEPPTPRQRKPARRLRVTDEQVVLIREMASMGASQAWLARMYHISPAHVFQIVHRHSRVHAEENLKEKDNARSRLAPA